MTEAAAKEYEHFLKANHYITLKEFEYKTTADVFGVIAQVDPVKRSRIGKNFSLKMTVMDPSTHANPYTVMFFYPEQDALPRAQTGDIIFMRHMRMDKFQNKPQIKSTHTLSFVCIDSHTKKSKLSKDIKIKFSLREASIVSRLQRWHQKIHAAKPPSPASVGFGRPILTTEQIVDSHVRFFDYVGMVVYCIPEENTRMSKANLLLTDYTVNTLPYLRDRDNSMFGIETNRLLQCTLWDENATHCPELKLGDYVFLRNCTRNEKNTSVLEISLRGDKEKKFQGKSRVTLMKEEDLALRDLLERKANYVHLEDNTRQRSASVESMDLGFNDPFRTRVYGLDRFESIQEILDAQEPGIHLTRAAITKLYPKNVEEWIQSYCQDCQITVKEPLGLCEECHKKTRAIYRLVINLDDDKKRLHLIATEDAAEQLFSSVSPEAALTNKDQLEKLKELVKKILPEDKQIGYDFGIMSVDEPNAKRKYYVCNTEFIENQ